MKINETAAKNKNKNTKLMKCIGANNKTKIKTNFTILNQIES